MNAMSRRRMAMAGGVVLLGLFSAGAAPGAAGPEDLFESLEEIDKLTLADLLKAETGVASLTRHSQRSSPGILSIITREEIRSSGARDLVDVLRRVPGFAFGTDVQGVLGVGFRGLWGHEGKVLLLLDGHEMNEGLYLTTQFGNHFPIDQIEKIEIIRGPGSAMYGGYGELSVINVVTRHGRRLEGPSACLSYGHTDGGFARRTVSIGYGETLEELGGLELSASGFLGQSRLSGSTYTDFGGASFLMRDNSGAEPAYLNLNAAWRGLELSFVYDGYKTLDRTGFGEAFGKPVRLGFPGYYLGARYELALGEHLTLTPRVRYKHQSPWNMVDSDPLARDAAYYKKTFERLDASLALAWKPLEGLDLAGGVQGQLDRATVHGELVGTNQPFSKGREVSYRNLALFLQGVWQNPIVDVTAGARYERHSAVGDSFVPRIGLTRQLGDLHLKALMSDAFKAPGVENISLNPEIRPEKTRVYEIEAGYLFGESVYAAVNLFDMTIDGPIVYSMDLATGEENYVNYNHAGVNGAEAVLRYEHPRVSAALAYAYYRARDNEVPVYAVPGEPTTLLGFARHKLAVSGRVEALRRLFVAPSLVFLSGRHGYTATGMGSAPQLERTASTWLVDLFVSYRPTTFGGLELGAGVYNLLGQRSLYLQPYDGGHAPIPSMGREIALRVAYEH